MKTPPPVDLPAALFVFSAANCVALDTACEQALGYDDNRFCEVWERGLSDIFEHRLTELEETLYQHSNRRQQLFIHAWVRALATRTS